MKRTTEIHRMDWNGTLLEITYESVWMPAHIMGEDVAHIEVRSIYPTAVPLPISRTGFYTNTLSASAVAAAGGPVAYVDVILAAEGGAP